jgi:putative heme-binding domain-containing protein
MLCALFVLLTPLHAIAQGDLKDIPDPDPEIERRSLQVPEGFEVNLFAADPLIAKPIQMNFDPRGRLWIASSSVYPQIEPGQVANDKVLVLEDNDGDGRADSTMVFAEGLLIPTGVEPGDGGAYVANSTELLHLRDTDGDGKADQRRIVLSGFGTEDTHHILHTLRWGFDGMLYFNQSIYIHSHIETPYGVRRLGGGGIWQFRPETMRLEVFLRGLVNPWGHHFDRWGQSFATDGAGGEGINYALPGAYYTTAPGAARILKGLNPGSPKHCGLEVASGRHLPDDWQGTLLTNDFRANRVCRFAVTDDGAGFSARELPELIKTNHRAFRPIDVKMGPDGAIYIADWYNPIIQHGEVDFRDPRRDHTRGRIWRVTAKGRPLVARPKLVDAPTPELLEALKAPEDWTREQAKRVLKERGAPVVPVLAAWVASLDPADAANDHHLLEALWTYQALDVPEPALLERLLATRDARVRAAATRVVQHWAGRLSDPFGTVARLVSDDSPRVRLEAVRVLAHLPDARSAEVALRALDRPMDSWLDYALWLTTRELAPVWLPRVREGQLAAIGGPGHLVFVSAAVQRPEVIHPIIGGLRSESIPPAQRDRALALVAALGNPAELATVLEVALGDERAELRARLLDVLADAARRRKVRPPGNLERPIALLDAAEESLRISAARALGAWGVEAARPRLIDLAGQPRTSAAACEALALLGDPASREALERLSSPSNPPPLRRQAVVSLATLDIKSAASRGALLLSSEATAGDDPGSLVEGFIDRKDGPAALAAALEGTSIPIDVAKQCVRVASVAGDRAAALAVALTRAGHIEIRPEPPTGAAREQLLADVGHIGDPARGESVFRRKDLACLKCHAIAGAGGQVGPGLESVGASAPLDYLLDSLFEPGKAIKENFHSLVVATNDGRVLTGIKLRQTDSELVLRDAEDREVSIPLAEIEDQKPGASLMPAGQTDMLTRGELLDLLRFLSELGKVGSYAVGKEAVARRWRVLEPSHELRGLSSAEIVGAGDRLQWNPAYSRVSGILPRESLAEAAGDGIAYVRCELDVSAGGNVRLLHNVPGDAVLLWVDSQARRASPETILALPLGPHRLTFAVPVERAKEGFRCELGDVAGSGALARFVIGK